MPIECETLKDKPTKNQCQKCKSKFEPFMRGQVQSFFRRVFGMNYCAIICRKCKEIVGWES